VAPRPAVQLGRPTCAGSAATGASLVGDVEQGLLDQPVEVERDCRPGNPQRGGDFVSAYGRGLAHDVLVELASGRLVQRCYRGHPAGQGLVHPHILKHNLIDENPSSF
jgi:hypothetical protein